MANRGTSSASGDVLVLNEDGTVTIGWDGRSGHVETTLQCPLVDEWLSFSEELEAADQWVRGEAPEDAETVVDGKPVAKSLAQALADGRYLRIYRRMLAELGGLDVDEKEMPMWLGGGNVGARVAGHWWSHPLSRREAAAVTRTLSR